MECTAREVKANSRSEGARKRLYRLRSHVSAIVWILAVGVHTTYSPAQEFPSKSGPQSTAQNTQDPVPAPIPASDREPSYTLPAATWPAIDFTRSDALLDRPYAAEPGFFANSETNILWMHLHNRLNAPVPNALTGGVDRVDLGRTNLDPTVAQRFEVGYRIPENWGTCSFGYGFLATQGHEVSATGANDIVQSPADKKGRLTYNMFDLTYGSREYSLDPLFNMRWGLGARMMFLFFDSRGEFDSPGGDPGSILAQSESSFVQCYGLWAYLDLERRVGSSGLSGFFRLEGSDFFARSHQTYTETVTGNPGQGPQTFDASFAGSVSPSILREIIGISYTVPQWNHSRFLLGYQYEQFFQIGRQSPTSGIIDTRGSLDAHGVFLRAEVNF
jgi:hypothetical protein